MFRFINILKYILIAILPFLIFVIIYRLSNGVNGGFDIFKLRFYFNTLDFNIYVDDLRTEFSDLFSILSGWLNGVTDSFKNWHVSAVTDLESFFVAIGDFFESLGNILVAIYNPIEMAFDIIKHTVMFVADLFKMISYFTEVLFGLFDYILKI